jgi:uncharacterized membrane protein HdeD (DUF308 family)
MAKEMTMADESGDSLWWMGIIEGSLTILFGIAALFWPGLTLTVLVILFSAYILIWGVIEIVRSFMEIGKGMWWLRLIFGLFALGVGVFLVRNPEVSFGTLVLLIGFTFIVRGLMDIVGSLIEKQNATARTLSIIGGAAAIILGIFVLRQPVEGGVAFVWLLGLFALFFGPLMIAMAFDVHKVTDNYERAM